MSLQYPPTSPYNPYTEPQKPTNLPKIILIIIGGIILILLAGYLILNPNIFTKSSDKDNDADNFSGEGNDIAYDCIADIYNCGNFTTQTEAQRVFDYCFSMYGDVHGLDKDGNGKVCESLT